MECSFIIAADHPALPGHFPGHPLVPGVIILDEVASAIAAHFGDRCAILRQAKLLSPLLPGQACRILLDKDETGMLRFECRVGARQIATGVFACAARGTEA